MSFDKAINFTLKWEGGYVNNPHDPGGETKFGISKRSYPNENIETLTVERAKTLYYRDFWLAGHCDSLPTKTAIVHFDTSVNCGLHGAAKLLQKALNELPDRKAVLKVDGIIGTKTLVSIEKSHDDAIADLYMLNRKEYYYDLVTKNHVLGEFLKGWTGRVNALKKFLETLEES